MKGYIYRHYITNEKGIERSYIGQVRGRKPEQRWNKGKGYTKYPESSMGRAVNKYGWENFDHEILLKFEREDVEELKFWLDSWESYYIEKYDSYYNGYNDTTGGSSCIFSESSRKRKSEKLKGHEVDFETRKKISEATKGRVPWNVGVLHTEESKKKMSAKQRGRKASKETKQRMSKSHKGKTVGKQNSQSIPVICINDGQEFESASLAGKWCGIKYSHDILSCARGKIKTCGKHPITGEKLTWKLKN